MNNSYINKLFGVIVETSSKQGGSSKKETGSIYSSKGIERRMIQVRLHREPEPEEFHFINPLRENVKTHFGEILKAPEETKGLNDTKKKLLQSSEKKIHLSSPPPSKNIFLNHLIHIKANLHTFVHEPEKIEPVYNIHYVLTEQDIDDIVQYYKSKHKKTNGKKQHFTFVELFASKMFLQKFKEPYKDENIYKKYILKVLIEIHKKKESSEEENEIEAEIEEKVSVSSKSFWQIIQDWIHNKLF